MTGETVPRFNTERVLQFIPKEIIDRLVELKEKIKNEEPETDYERCEHCGSTWATRSMLRKGHVPHAEYFCQKCVSESVPPKQDDKTDYYFDDHTNSIGWSQEYLDQRESNFSD